MGRLFTEQDRNGLQGMGGGAEGLGTGILGIGLRPESCQLRIAGTRRVTIARGQRGAGR